LVIKRGGDAAKGLSSLKSMAALETIISQDLYGDFEAEARKRLGCPILTEDTDFFGCGVATWASANVGSFLGQ